jgi:predicted nicotinamide N-methyase
MNPSLSLLERFAPLSPVSECPQVRAHQAEDLFGLWQSWEDESGALCEVPYWGIVWPAARVLAQYLFANPALVKGRSVLDCGCGCGVAAIAADANGAAAVTGCDLDETAVAIGGLNALANQVTVDFRCQDVIECCEGQRFDLILVADLFYQREFSAALMAALRTAHQRGCEVVIADSGRPFLPKEELAEVYSQTAATSFAVEGCLARTVRLYRFS